MRGSLVIDIHPEICDARVGTIEQSLSAEDFSNARIQKLDTDVHRLASRDSKWNLVRDVEDLVQDIQRDLEGLVEDVNASSNAASSSTSAINSRLHSRTSICSSKISRIQNLDMTIRSIRPYIKREERLVSSAEESLLSRGLIVLA